MRLAENGKGRLGMIQKYLLAFMVMILSVAISYSESVSLDKTEVCPTASVSCNLVEKQPGYNYVSLQWSVEPAGGTFSSPNSDPTNWTAPQVSAITDYNIKVSGTRTKDGQSEEFSTQPKTVKVFIVKITQPNPSTFTFISTDDITCAGTAGSHSSEINWTCVDAPGGIDSGEGKPKSATGSSYTFKPKPPADKDGRNGKLSYKITASLTLSEITYDTRIIITQDEINQIRQEYIDLEKKVTPGRSSFVNASSYINPGNFSFRDINDGTYLYAIFSIAQHLQNIRNIVNLPMKVISGYRNPVKNVQVKGKEESRHMYGIAADITNDQDYNGDGTHVYKDYNDWFALAKEAWKERATYVEPYKDSGSWVHMDWH